MGARGIQIPDSDLSVSFVRSSGPGGQNVNKVATAVQLRFDVRATAVLDETAKQRLRKLAGHRMTADDSLLIVARNHRTQEQNRRAARARLEALIIAARTAPKKRKPTAPTRASRERRLATKAHGQQTKRLRGKVGWDD
ncbi:MAG TPA: alternative ribosome rescue aminoacyl-tRNA hydrolase ArfB [Steroidobacteraceae bacterium]|jgi:ribosome-associated protein